MKCVFCSCMQSRVVDSRQSEDGLTIRRRRECENCGRRFTTYERIDMIPLMVVKKDETREPFQADKLRHGIGHEIVENICRKYSGSFSHTVTGTTFEATAMVLDLAPKETRLR